MATAVQKITLSASRDIPFNKLVLSQANVRRVKAGVSIEELAEDIARRTLLQGLSVRAVVDADGNETGIFEVPAGGRRFRALELLVKQKRLAKTAPVPCVVRDGGIAEEDSLAENVQRVALHRLDQFRAFHALREKGLGDEEIAARFFVNPTVVKQRLRLAAVSPKLLDIYAEDSMTLEQLMAFTVTADHDRQQQVWDSVSRSYNKEPYLIRRQLTERAVRASDRCALFVGAETYEAAGGVVMRDLFQHDDGGWLQDPALLDRLVTEKLQAEAETLRDEGWKWIAVATDFPYGHSAGLRRLVGETTELTEDEAATCEACGPNTRRWRPSTPAPTTCPRRSISASARSRPRWRRSKTGRSGSILPASPAPASSLASIATAHCASSGASSDLRMKPVEPVATETDEAPEATRSEMPVKRAVITIGGAPSTSEPEAPEEDDTITPLSDRLVTELTAHRTLALRDGVANDPQVAFQAVLHALCLNAFYRYAASTCLEITRKQSSFSAQAPGLAETASAKAIDAREAQWAKQLPETPADLWDTLTAFDSDSQAALFAHCASLTVNVVKEPWNRRPDAFAHGDQLARAVGLDMAARRLEADRR
jgi:ParB family transcriptional regulator, chromosome partitioning protein